MGWFDDQIHARKQMDEDGFSAVFDHIAGAVTGKRVVSALNDDQANTDRAMHQILRYYHLEANLVPERVQDMSERIDYMIRPHGMAQREVHLEAGWYKDAIGAMLGTLKADGTVVALIPNRMRGYCYFDPVTEQFVKINRQNQHLFSPEAIAFYKPFPLRKLSVGSLVQYIAQSLAVWDYVCMIAAVLIVTLLGMLTPRIANILFSVVIETRHIQLLVALAAFAMSVTISTTIFTSVKRMVLSRINTRMQIQVQAATMLRLLSLPASFFKQYSSGDLSARVASMNNLCSIMVSTVFSTGLTSIFSIVYIAQIFRFARSLVWPSLIFTLLSLASMLIAAFLQMGVSRKLLKVEGHEGAMTYSFITGIQKIRLAGAEKRVFAQWGNSYAEKAKLQFQPPSFVKLQSVITLAISMAGTFVIYYAAFQSQVTVADYYAFNTAYGMISGALTSLSSIIVTIASIRPVLERVQPLLETVPEVSEGKQLLQEFSGRVELNSVSFRYQPSLPYVLNKLSLTIPAGQYVAIVGETGCGKSTLVRLLLGLETPNKGAIYYDGKDLTSLELKSVRRKIGTVLQNGKLFFGDIYANIVISAPWLTMKDAWEAAETAGLAEDIRRMPMGMNTMIAEGGGGFSGRQKQRLMIARAIAPKPKMLIFDEATSALDNITQKQVSQALDSLHCTRIVIAHHLSTIRNCDRILVLHDGKIIEDGTYQQLVEQNGFFAELVHRQRLDEEP